VSVRPEPPDQGDRWIRGFLVARGLLERAEGFVDGSAAGAVAAVIVSDLAVETAAKVTVAENPPVAHPGDGYILRPNQRRGPRRDPSLPEVLDDVLAAWRERANDEKAVVIELQEAAKLREFRNSVQHAGVVPSTEDVGRSRLRAVDAVRLLARNFFATELEQISRAQLIASTVVRGRVLLAEQHAEKDKYDQAMAQLWLALQQSLDELRESREFRRHRQTSFGLQQAVEAVTDTRHTGRNPLGSSSRDLSERLKEMIDRLEELEDLAEALSVGAEPEEYIWFRETAPRPFRTINEIAWRLYDVEPKPGRSEYIRAHEFVLTTALKWQRLPPRRTPGRPTGEVSEVRLADPPDN
jgi:hypothetical protein